MSVLVCTIRNLFDVPVHETQAVEDLVLERGLLTVPDEVWQLAVQRAAVIGQAAAAVQPPGRDRPAIVLLNPRITASSADTDEQYEGCLSFFDVRGRSPAR